MNIVNRLRGHTQSAAEKAHGSADVSLGLTHLRKLFADFRSPPPNCTQKMLEDKLYNMLPLFCRIFGSLPSSEMTEKFGDILLFCSHVCRLLVSEIRKRASNQSTADASCAITKLLEISSSEEASNGWMLLSSVNLLSAGPVSLIDCMTAASLPSTLVKCLYLFFDLPPIDNPDVHQPGCEFTPREQRVLLQKVFTQILVRLCGHASPAEELSRKDDLTLLFMAVTSPCPAHNNAWRKSAGDVLTTLSRHGLTPNVVHYLHVRGCLAQCLENMQRLQELSPLELVEMFVSVFCFLKDSSDTCQTLLDDFRSCQGYTFLTDFLLRMEKESSEDAVQALRNLVLMIASLTTCGYIDIKPNVAAIGSPFNIPGFSVPQPQGKGASVRNLSAFQVLQTVFLKATSGSMLSIILDVINSIYHQDDANYFILESQNTLSQFAEKIHAKPADVQVKFFETIEFVVNHLNYVPCKELISLSILIKTNSSVPCSLLCMKTLINILKSHDVFRDVYREVGLLEVSVTCMHRYAAFLKDTHTANLHFELRSNREQESELGRLSLDMICQLLMGNVANAGVFRECGGARCAHNMVTNVECETEVLSVIHQLVLTTGSDEDMGNLLGLMHTAQLTDLHLKALVLKTVLAVVRDSHRARTAFRKVGGFVYVMSVLVSMEGCLATPPKSPWDTVSRADVITLLRTVFATLTIAMRFEPANARYFAAEVRFSSLTDAVRLLGCFSQQVHVQPYCGPPLTADATRDDLLTTAVENDYDVILCSSPDLVSHIRLVTRCLEDMALDTYDIKKKVTASPQQRGLQLADRVPSIGRLQKKSSMNSLAVGQLVSEALIVHPGAVTALLHLVPSIQAPDALQTASIQYAMCELIKSLMRGERNQQVMCEAGMPHELLTRCHVALADELHPLHTTLQFIFERLAAQSLMPRDLRDYLRLCQPLHCLAEDEMLFDARRKMEASTAGPTYALMSPTLPSPTGASHRLHTTGGPLPLTQVKCLVSMTTPRDSRFHSTSITPSFVEFDMSIEGFGCLYLPSMAPQGTASASMVSASMMMTTNVDNSVVGGIGTGERLFPPQSGITFSTWLCVDRYASQDSHPVRLLTISRSLQGRDEAIACLSIFLSTADKCLCVSTSELPIPAPGTMSDIELETVLQESCVRYSCEERIIEGQWCHIAISLGRSGLIKSNSVCCYINGQLVTPMPGSHKLSYISPNIGGVQPSVTPSVAVLVSASIGTLPQLRRNSQLLWRLGYTFVYEEPLALPVIRAIHSLGPSYVGMFHSLASDDTVGYAISEEKVTFAVLPHTMSQMTVARLRKVYSRTDARVVASLLAVSTRENSTPIRILHNAASHLPGPARSLGAVVVGYLGIRTFCPKPVAKVIMNVGGPAAMLGLVAMAADVESMYAAVKALVCVVHSNRIARREMERTNGYQTLAMLFRKKHHLLNSHILHLTFALVGTVDSGRETTIIPNKIAFADLLCDLEVWHCAPNNLQRSLYEHFFELLTESSEHQANLALMQELGLVSKLLHILRDASLSHQTVQTIASVLLVLLSTVTSTNSLLRFGQFLVSLLPEASVSEKTLVLPQSYNADESPSSSDTLSGPLRQLVLRNICLDLLAKLFVMHANGQLKDAIPDEVVRVLGFDWLMLFLQGHLHSSTVTLAFKLLVYMLSYPLLLARFREGTGGAWLKDELRMNQTLDFGLGGRSRSLRQSTSQEVCRVPGFALLPSLLQRHTEIVDLYILLLGLIFGQPPRPIPDSIRLELDSVWRFLFDSVPATSPHGGGKASQVDVCIEGAVCLLAMTRAMLNQPWQNEEEGSWLLDRPVAVVHVLMSLYQHRNEMHTACMTSDFISALSATLFPIGKSVTDVETDTTTPDDNKTFGDVVIVTTPASEGLTKHPARRHVLEFLRSIVLDALAFQAPNKQPVHIVDQLLESFPEYASRTQQCEFQTEVIHMLMDHLTGADVLLGEQSAVALWPGSSYSNLSGNVFYFTARIVDCLWQDCYKRDPKEVFDFILHLLMQAKRRTSGSSLTLDPLFRCWNRTVLYQLSRPVKAAKDKSVLWDILQVLMTNRSLIFGPGNVDEEFVGCLTYCLVQFTDNVTNISSPPLLRRTTWHVDSSELDPQSQAEAVDVDVDKNLATIAARLWGELYIHKKPTIEEILHISFPAGENDRNSDLMAIRPLLSESSARVWSQYLENERKSVYSQMDRTPNQLQSKLQKVGQGVWRLASRRSKKEVAVKQLVASAVSLQDITSWTKTHISVIKELVDSQHRAYLQSDQLREQFLLDEWLKSECQLVRERGLWGPTVGSELDKWMLDMSEGPFRMRKRMCKNSLFYSCYPYHPSDVVNKMTLRGRCAISLDSRLYYERYGNRKQRGMLDLMNDVSSAPTSNGGHDVSPSVADNSATPEPVATVTITSDNTDDKNVNAGKTADDVFLSAVDGNVSSLFSTLRRVSRSKSAEAEKEETPEAELVSIAEAVAGETDVPLETALDADDAGDSDSLVFTRHFEDGERINFVCRCARIQGLDTVEGILMFGKEHLYIADGFTVLRTKVITAISSLPAEQLEPIIPPSSATVAVSTNECIKFSYDDIREIHKRRYLLQPIALEIFSSDGRNVLLAFPKKLRNGVHVRLEQVATALINDAKESLAGQRQSAKVEQGTGFINSLIGEKSVTQRWERGEISNFEYLMCLNTLAGRSYNDLMQYPIFPWILADYESEELDLADPTTFRDLSKPMGAQTPDRLKQFQKRYNDWDDPSGETPPYHYGTHYSSAMIVASYLVRTEPFTQIFLRLQGGHFDLADRMFHSVKDAWFSASKHNMADVKELIPEFFYLPEMFVNANNFDLGTKQSGVSLGDILLPPWAKGDPREFIRVHREALECEYVSQRLHEWIDLIFGYKQQGPPAAEAVNVFHHLFYEDNVDFDNITDPLQKSAIIGFVNNFGQIPSQLFKKPHPQKRQGFRLIDTYFFHQLDNLRPSLQPVKELKAAIGQIVCMDRLLCVEQNKVLIPPLYNRFLTWGFSDMSLRMGSYESERAQLVFEGLDDSEVLCAACPNAKTIVTGGTGTVVNVWGVVKSRERRLLILRQPLYGHTDTVTCLAASASFNIVLSGSRDRSCIVWDLCKLVFIRQLRGHAAPVAAVCVNDLTGDMATCAGMYLHVWSINGDEIASINMSSGRSDHILCVAMSQAAEWSNENVILTGSSDGVVRMWSVEYVQISTKASSQSPANTSATNLSSSTDVNQLASDLDLSRGEAASGLVTDDNQVACQDDCDMRQACVELSSSPDSDSELSWPDINRTVRPLSSISAAAPSIRLQKQDSSGTARPSLLQSTGSLSSSSGAGEEGSAKQEGGEFVVISQADAKDAMKASLGSPSPAHRLREGFHWQRQLVFRSKLTMHTAFERKDNKEPASITALAMSRDHKTVFVGDSRGRVWSWSVSDQQRRATVADHWVKDDSVDGCVSCGVRFTFSERRHHCRNCGQVFCSRCSRYEMEIPRLRIVKPVRVCQVCYNKLKGQQALEAFGPTSDAK